MSENMEIIFIDFKKEYLDSLLIELKNSDIKSSHFYNTETKQDLELHEITNISDVFKSPGTGNIVFARLNLEVVLLLPYSLYLLPPL